MKRRPSGSRCVGTYVAGISLLEVLVALVLVATVGLAMVNWMQQVLQSTRRHVGHRHLLEQVRDASAWLQVQNPTQRTSGEVRFGRLWLRWRSRPEGAPQPNQAFSGEGAVGAWQLSVHHVDAELSSEPGGAALIRFALKLHQRTRS